MKKGIYFLLAERTSPKHGSWDIIATLQPFTNRNYTIFWFGAFINGLGYFMQVIAQGWQLLQLGNSPFVLGVASLAENLPLIALSPVVGGIADRMSRRILLLFTQSGMLLAQAVLTLLTLLHSIEVWHILILTLIIGIIRVPNTLAMQAIVSDILPTEQVKQGATLNMIRQRMQRVLGFVFGAVFISMLHISGVYIINILSSIVILVALLFMKIETQISLQADQKLSTLLGEGFTYIRSQALIAALLLLQLCIILFVSPYTRLLPVFAGNIFRGGVQELGVMSTAVSIGTVIGSLLLGYVSHRIKDGMRPLAVLCGIAGVACAVFAYTNSLLLALLMLFLLGACDIMSTAITNAMIQVKSSLEMRGRMMSLWVLIVYGMVAIGDFLASCLAQVVGVQLTLAIGGITCILGTLLIFNLNVLLNLYKKSRNYSE